MPVSTDSPLGARRKRDSMYSDHSAADFRDHLGLPEDYEVEAFLTYGCWDLYAEAEQLPLLARALDVLQVKYELRRIPIAALGHAYELIVGGKVYWYAPIMGTAVLAQYLHIASLLGSKRNLLLGTVGGLAPGMRTGELIIPTGSYGNDNARFYDRENETGFYLPDSALSDVLAAQIEKVRIWRGPTVTCEMMFAETQADVQQWSAEGSLGVEMEAALMFAASNHFEIPAAALLYVADNLIEGQTMLTPGYAEHTLSHAAVRQQQYVIGLRTLFGFGSQVTGA
jgi:nucleoside phosphorylase